MLWHLPEVSSWPTASPPTPGQIWTDVVLFHSGPMCQRCVGLRLTSASPWSWGAPWRPPLGTASLPEHSVRTGRCLLGQTPGDLRAVVLGSHSGCPGPRCPLQPSEGPRQGLTVPEAGLSISAPPRGAWSLFTQLGTAKASGGSWEWAEPSQPLPSMASRVERHLVEELALLKGLHKLEVEKSCLLEGVPDAKGTDRPFRRRQSPIGDPLWNG